MHEFGEYGAYGVHFNHKHTWDDFHLRVLDKIVTLPAKSPVTISPPYSNSIIDLSALYGHQVFKERTVKVTFLLTAWETHTKEQLYRKWAELVNWLQGIAGRQPLIDDIMSGYYYLGEVVKAPSWDEMRLHGKLTVEWDCYPFRISREPEGNDIWNKFDFDFGVSQYTSFEVAGTRKATLLNVGEQSEQPIIIASSNFTVSVTGGRIYQIPTGTNKPDNTPYPFTLPTGASELVITGNGSIEFRWHKEMI